MHGLVQIRKGSAVIASRCEIATSFVSRFLGLMGRSSLAADQAMLFPNTNSVHMWFMRFPIDVLFLRREASDQWLVSSLREGARPWKLLPMADLHATDTLELPAGTSERLAIKEGDQLCSS